MKYKVNYFQSGGAAAQEYNPDREIGDFAPPETVPTTQSIFYMPIITEAYLWVKKDLSDCGKYEFACNSAGYILNLKSDYEIDKNTYNKLVMKLKDYLKENNNDNYNKLNELYENDIRPRKDNVGHIPGHKQEQILEQTIFDNTNIKVMFDIAITLHYSK